jgi:hypothetical protein
MNKLQIKNLGVLSVAKIYGVFGLIIGLIAGVVYFIVAVLFGASVAGKSGAAAGGASFVYGLIMLVVIPIVYAATGFIGGA